MINNKVEEIKAHVKAISDILGIKETASNENTALRISKMLTEELFANRNDANLEELNSRMKVFPIEAKVLKPITVGDIPFYSMCFVGKTPVRMKSGVKYIRDVVVGDVAITFDESGNVVEAPVTHIMNRKTDNTLKVHLSNGKTLRCTPEHPFFVEDKGWVSAVALEPHDSVRTFNGRHFPSATTWDFTVNEGYDFGYALGAIASDGSTWRNQTRLEVNDMEFALSFVESLKKAFNIDSEIVGSKYTSGFTPGKFSRRNLVRVISGYFVEYLKEIFGGSTRSKEFVFPQVVLNSFESFEGFIHGYYMGDGSFSNNASIITANEEFANCLSSIFDSCHYMPQKGIHSVSLPLHILGFHKREIFKTRFRDKFDATLLNKVPVTVNPLMAHAEVLSVEELPPYSVNVYNFEVEGNHTYLASDIWVHNCEHHWLPFFGEVSVSYIPNNCIVGLSKIPRVVKYFSRRPQLQERLTEDIGNYLFDLLKPNYLKVVITAEHLCMKMRGVEIGGKTTTIYEE